MGEGVGSGVGSDTVAAATGWTDCRSITRYLAPVPGAGAPETYCHGPVAVAAVSNVAKATILQPFMFSAYIFAGAGARAIPAHGTHSLAEFEYGQLDGICARGGQGTRARLGCTVVQPGDQR